MERLNQVVKDHVSNLGANIAERSVLQCGQSLKRLMEVCSYYELHPYSTSHTNVSIVTDEKKFIKELTTTSRVFYYIPGRAQPTFKPVCPTIAQHIDKTELLQWLQKQKKSLHVSIIKATVFNHSV